MRLEVISFICGDVNLRLAGLTIPTKSLFQIHTSEMRETRGMGDDAIWHRRGKRRTKRKKKRSAPISTVTPDCKKANDRLRGPTRPESAHHHNFIPSHPQFTHRYMCSHPEQASLPICTVWILLFPLKGIRILDQVSGMGRNPTHSTLIERRH